MTGVRPAVRALVARWAETAIALAVLGAGLRIAAMGGYLLLPAGLVLAALGGAWALLSWRRMRFQSEPTAPGLVEIDEGRLRYLHPAFGGEVALHDLAELRLLALAGRRVWGLRDLHGAGLLIPLDSAGAGALFDAFATLPGLSSQDLMAALDGRGRPAPAHAGGLLAPAAGAVLVWQRKGPGLRPV